MDINLFRVGNGHSLFFFNIFIRWIILSIADQQHQETNLCFTFLIYINYFVSPFEKRKALVLGEVAVRAIYVFMRIARNIKFEILLNPLKYKLGED